MRILDECETHFNSKAIYLEGLITSLTMLELRILCVHQLGKRSLNRCHQWENSLAVSSTAEPLFLIYSTKRR